MIDFKKMRLALDMKQKDIAETLGITPATWNMIEKGKANLTERNKRALIEKLNINPKWLETGEEPIYKSGKTRDELIESIETGIQHLNKRDKQLLYDLMNSMIENKE